MFPGGLAWNPLSEESAWTVEQGDGCSAWAHLHASVTPTVCFLLEVFSTRAGAPFPAKWKPIAEQCDEN